VRRSAFAAVLGRRGSTSPSRPSRQGNVNPYSPSVAGQMIIGHTKFAPPGHLLGPWAGFAVFCAYTAATLIAAANTLHRRDA
jgi:ABC-2 type transport system permease protein